MKILVLSGRPWASDNSFGNSFSNIFEGIEDIKIANIFCGYGSPDNNIVSRYFQITEKSLIRNLFNRRYPSGKEITASEEISRLDKNETAVFDHARKLRLQIYFWVRDIIWKSGRWKSPDLKKFISDFSPDVIFQPVYYSPYLNDIACFLKDYTGAPMVGYITDDNYTLKQFSLSPLYWIDRFIVRGKVKKVIGKCGLF